MAGKTAVTYEMIANALFENYESIYDIHLDSSEYVTYYQSEKYKELKLSKEGKDFFRELPDGVRRIIAKEDQDYVIRKLKKETLLSGLAESKYYTLVYRIQKEDRKKYHQLRATLQPAEDGVHILMGIRDIDELMQQQILQRNLIEGLQEKEKNHLEAVLASAAAYLEADLTNNQVLEKSFTRVESGRSHILRIPSITEYDLLQNWIIDHRIIDGREKYKKICSREYLLSIFQNGDKRTSVPFSIKAEGQGEIPCRAVFYLYQEKATKNLRLFCVIYDLTQQQRQEQEKEALAQELILSRIRNSTSQMQPHFIYNVLGSIQELVLLDPQYASDVLGDFTVYLRSCVRAIASDEPIHFTEELNNIQAYVNIEKMRFGNKLNVQYKIQTEDFHILPLSIQPLVENAIRHGIYKKGNAGGTVTICTSEKDNWIEIRVIDDGVGFDENKMLRDIKKGRRDSTGLGNIRFRLEKVMGARIQMKSEIGKGTTVTIRLPRRE